MLLKQVYGGDCLSGTQDRCWFGWNDSVRDHPKTLTTDNNNNFYTFYIIWNVHDNLNKRQIKIGAYLWRSGIFLKYSDWLWGLVITVMYLLTKHQNYVWKRIWDFGTSLKPYFTRMRRLWRWMKLRYCYTKMHFCKFFKLWLEKVM